MQYNSALSTVIHITSKNVAHLPREHDLVHVIHTSARAFKSAIPRCQSLSIPKCIAQQSDADAL